MSLSDWHTKWKKKRLIKAFREAKANRMKITRAAVLAQMGTHRTPLDDIIEGLGIKPPNSNSRHRMLYAFRLIKLGWILICLLWEGVISDDRGDYWINF